MKISITDELLERLEAVREKHGLRTTNIVASEVVEEYLDLYDAVEDRRKKLIARQHKKVLDKLGPPPRRARR